MKKALILLFTILLILSCIVSLVISKDVVNAETSEGGCYGVNCPTTTHTSTLTQTITQTLTKLFTHTPTETSTSTPTSTLTDTPTVTVTVTPTLTIEVTDTPTRTETKITVTQSKTGTKAPPTVLIINTKTPDPTSTEQVEDTNTPIAPKTDYADGKSNYSGKYLGGMKISDKEYELYQGINDKNGVLELPEKRMGAAVYEKTIWLHRMWESGWVEIETGDIVEISIEKFEYTYKVTKITIEEFGKYFTNPLIKSDFQYIASCISDESGNWIGIELYHLELVSKIKIKSVT